MTNVTRLLTQSLLERGDAPALHIATWKNNRCSVQTTSFAQMQTMIAHAQHILKRIGVKADDSLLVLSDVSAQTYAMIIAAVALGAVIVFAPPAQKKSQTLAFVKKQKADYALIKSSNILLRVVLRVMGIKTVAVDQAADHFVRQTTALEIAEPADIAEKPALISYSSGTTGAPKPIVRTHGKLARQFALMDKYLCCGEAQTDFTYMGVMALFNMGKGWTSLIPVNMDYTAPEISRELSRLVDNYRPARFTGSSTFVASGLRNASAAGRASVKYLVLGGAPTDEKILAEIAQSVPHAQTLIFYGSTEAEPIAILPIGADIAQQYAGAGYPVGKPIAEIEINIDAEKFRAPSDSKYAVGEILVKGAHVISVNKDGWLNTGDTGYFDENGQLWLTGRAKEAIANGSSGAVPTYPLEKTVNMLPKIERSALIRHPNGARLFVELVDGKTFDNELNDTLDKELKRLPLQDVTVQCIAKMPLDNRHRCKINRLLLEQKL